MDTIVTRTITHISHRWEGTDRTLLFRVIPLLAKGRPVLVADVAEGAGAEVETVEAHLALAGAERNPAGEIVELGGVSLTPGPFRVAIGDVGLFTCCAITAHALPILLGRPVRVSTADPLSAAPVRLTIAPQKVESVDPETALATFVTLDEPARREGLGDSFCRWVRYFASPAAATRFECGNRKCLNLSPEQVHDAARLWVSVVWGAA